MHIKLVKLKLITFLSNEDGIVQILGVFRRVVLESIVLLADYAFQKQPTQSPRKVDSYFYFEDLLS